MVILYDAHKAEQLIGACRIEADVCEWLHFAMMNGTDRVGVGIRFHNKSIGDTNHIPLIMQIYETDYEIYET